MEFSFEFAKRLIEAAEQMLGKLDSDEEAGRTILYLSCVSCEISMKALLEQTGYSIKELKAFSHRLEDLLAEICKCGHKDADQRASSIRAILVVPNTSNGTVGTLLSSPIGTASTYPNEIRYGDMVKHFHPTAILECAKAVSGWCIENVGKLVRAKAS